MRLTLEASLTWPSVPDRHASGIASYVEIKGSERLSSKLIQYSQTPPPLFPAPHRHDSCSFRLHASKDTRGINPLSDTERKGV